MDSIRADNSVADDRNVQPSQMHLQTVSLLFYLTILNKYFMLFKKKLFIILFKDSKLCFYNILVCIYIIFLLFFTNQIVMFKLEIIKLFINYKLF